MEVSCAWGDFMVVVHSAIIENCMALRIRFLFELYKSERFSQKPIFFKCMLV